MGKDHESGKIIITSHAFEAGYRRGGYGAIETQSALTQPEPSLGAGVKASDDSASSSASDSNSHKSRSRRS